MGEKKREAAHDGVHGFTSTDHYVMPTDPGLIEQLEHFQDQKLGLMMHWAPGCQLGIFESWCMSDDSAHWSKRDVDWTDDMNVFREQYRNLYKSFNPVRFQPELWADIASQNGFKYLLFTTKHHDGFCMWDTNTTEYKITNESCPHSTSANADICRSLFDAFRSKGLSIHTYFSKPDWSSPYFWSPEFASPDGRTQRSANYSISENPELWERFVRFTHEQITELMTRYGKIDVLWLDGGWVRPDNKDQDVRIGELAEKLRSTVQPHLLVADRTVGGAYENIITPEQTMPDKPLLVPWESCITLGKRFSFSYEEEFKQPREIVHMFIQIIAKGGNLALNIAPQPDGRLPCKGVEVLQELGAFLKVNGEAVYGTRACAPYLTDRLAFTRKGNRLYAFYLYPDEAAEPVQRLELPVPGRVQAVSLLGSNHPVQLTEAKDGSMVIQLAPRSFERAPYAEVIQIDLA
ncbi:alpha-L-fucosidase [Paenibacillus silviterrae]|uniref:alpha-L-fucosidase n=1 Tax=Paenibacillus silviterrae TaxID=3242194 RepID=UPI0025427F7D|nr:alpha-L-fucosidase [Paenibacillus chinjuensis]